jgi:hypothetical protein
MLSILSSRHRIAQRQNVAQKGGEPGGKQSPVPQGGTGDRRHCGRTCILFIEAIKPDAAQAWERRQERVTGSDKMPEPTAGSAAHWQK